MDAVNFAFAQGSTPTLELLLPLEIDSDSDVVYATLSQGFETALEFAINGTPAKSSTNPGTLIVAEDDPSMLYLSMTQADTLALDVDDVILQIRAKTSEGADTFLPLYGRVVAATKKEVIS